MADITLWPPNHGECLECHKYRPHVRAIQYKSDMKVMCYNCWFEFHLDQQDIDSDGVKLVRMIWPQDTSFNYCVPRKIESKKIMN
jgi:hypothetical protein